MREIKFRAWDKREAKMIYFDIEDLLDLQCKTETESLGITDAPDNRMYETLTQYTGLKDSKGVEIYEGDIITAKWHYEEPTVIESLEDFFYDIREYALYGKDMEVIGNIYEHKHLLE